MSPEETEGSPEEVGGRVFNRWEGGMNSPEEVVEVIHEVV